MTNLEILGEKLTPLERKVLPVLKTKNSLKDIQKATELKEIEITRALQWLENKKLVKIEKSESEIVEIAENGKEYLETGLPEKRFLKALTEPLTLNEIKDKAKLTKEEINACLGLLKRKKAIDFILKGKIKITKEGKKLKFPEEELLKQLPIEKENITKKQKEIIKELNTRKGLIKTETKKLLTTKLTDLGRDLLKTKINPNLIETLTSGMLKNETWRNKKFRRYDVEVNVPKIYPGKRHFINESIERAKQIWLDMGFEEMTGNIINTSFWNFDALFTAQDHPVREMQDTFFIKGTGGLPSNFKDKVKKQHEHSWKYKWSEDEAKKLVLRTHTTVLSAKTISKLEEKDLPKKYFAIGRNYRNEALDWSHLFEFNQTEGIVIDPNANFKHLLGYLKQFFKKMGYEKVRFRPAYFPYTEPSLEIDAYIPEKKTWIELGGAGIFRPEVVKPLLGKDIPVLAWGPGFDRIVMMYNELKDIRDLYKNDLKQLKEIKIGI
jgi:phenylalanyl-tRNA synthetase alpha chain